MKQSQKYLTYYDNSVTDLKIIIEKLLHENRDKNMQLKHNNFLKVTFLYTRNVNTPEIMNSYDKPKANKKYKKKDSSSMPTILLHMLKTQCRWSYIYKTFIEYWTTNT